jgi:succinate dehydrogenase flavin-adding protein (antitoxin of CptAB toxin-antitoxin module)
MTIEMFIDRNRDELVTRIRTQYNPAGEFSDDEIETWIMNDEELYNWAVGEGVEP